MWAYSASLIINYINNLKLGVDFADSSGGFMEGTLSYMGYVSDPNKGKYNIEYYIKLTRDLTNMGVHSLDITTMAGLHTPLYSTMLVLVLREELPNMPLHMTFPS